MNKKNIANNSGIIEIKKWIISINSRNLFEKIFLIIFCIYIIFLSFGASIISTNPEPILFLIPFVILSGGLTFRARTLIRAILFCIVTMIPILCSILNLAFDHNLDEYCKEKTTNITNILYADCINFYQNEIGLKHNYSVENNVGVKEVNDIAILVILCIFQILFIISVILLWYKRYWKFLPQFTLTTRKDIKRMFAQYIYLISLTHSIVIIIGYWMTISWFYRIKLTYLNYQSSFFKVNKMYEGIIPFPLPLFIFMILMIKKGVQKESRLRMVCFYILNVAFCMLMFSQTIFFCFIPSYYIGLTTSPIKNCDFTNQIQWSPPYQVTFILGMTSILILIITSLNAYFCQRNFGKKLKIYLAYEVEPIEFEYKDDPLLDQDTDDDL